MGSELVRRQESIVGPEHLVRATLATQYRQGRLVTPPEKVMLVRLTGGQVATLVDLLMDKPLPWRKRNPLLFGSLVALTVSVMLFAAGWLLIHAVMHTLATVDRPAALGVAVIAGGLAVALLVNRSNHRGACPGVAVHCNGCKH